MKDWLITIVLKIVIWLRWAYFNLNWNYVPFTIGNELHFQNTKTGSIHCQLIIKG